ncbi:hypothetical protein Hs30E_12650 [Lactococcus hodotermopsidis]|uniref:Uncharacterized protein n=1 Tax=Pseudolactococcus hodotermopsidis TaxID=2709157 RepID=A0A6A0BE08_9LACT|nr:hypothetical protein Hs30E_12650 [Lactococcus hodotermopsidis]
MIKSRFGEIFLMILNEIQIELDILLIGKNKNTKTVLSWYFLIKAGLLFEKMCDCPAFN